MLLPILIIVAYLTVFVFGYYYALASHSTFWLILLAFAMLVGAFVLWFFFWNRTCSILSRRRFCAKIKRLARKKGYTCAFSHAPRQAFFEAYVGEDLILTTDRQTYYLKFFPYFARKKNIHIVDAHNAVFSKPWALVAPRRVYGMATVAMTESLFDHTKKIELDFGAVKDGAERIVIVSPACHKLTCVKANGRDVIDNAYRFSNGISFWFQDSFIEYLKRC